MNILIVDNDIQFRAFMRQCLSDLEHVNVVGTACHGKEALLKMETLKPDLVTLDMEMPHLSGVEVLKQMQTKHPHMRVVIVSCETETDAQRTIEALKAGACDFVLKPNNTQPAAKKKLQDILFPVIEQAQSIQKVLGLTRPAYKSPTKPASQPTQKVIKKHHTTRPDIVAIGSSTGGPAALYKLLTHLPANYPIPITITQHMPKMFLESLAQRIDKDSPLSCALAQDGEVLKAGHIYLAPGDVHMKIKRQGVYLSVALEEGQRVHHCIPAVDVTYDSLAELAPRVKTLAVVLTGMGSDGALGAKALADKKNTVIAQDKASSSVWGMPGETVRLGAAHEVLPLEDIPQALCQHAGINL